MRRIEPKGMCAELVVTHACGHEGRIAFGGASVAERNAPKQEARLCVACYNSQQGRPTRRTTR